MKAVFDTNILIDFLNGVPAAAQELSQYSNKIISITTYIEVMVGARSVAETDTLKTFLTNFEIVSLNEAIANKTIELRQQHKRKLPDSIIYATSKIEQCLLVTRNTRDFDPALADIRLPYQL